MQRVCVRSAKFFRGECVCVSTCARCTVVTVCLRREVSGGGRAALSPICCDLAFDFASTFELAVLVGRLRFLHFLFLRSQLQRIRVAICVRASC